ncbi:MAG: hypothetical protein KDC54_07025, partial [Lewinella sp.]|nr:hypothetical protein [Lewinella sp.]
MQITKIHLHHLHIPLRLTFAQANQRTRSSASLIVRLETSHGVAGYGESCPRTYVTGESMEGATQTIRRLKAEVLFRRFDRLTDIRDWALACLDEGYGPAAVCALELALIDAWCQTYQEDLVTALGGRRPAQWQYSGVVPYGPWEKLVPILGRFRFASLKAKAYASVEDNLVLVQHLRGLPDGGDQLRLDANGGWHNGQASRNIKALLAQGVHSFEQPVAVGAEDDMGALVREFGQTASIMADESLVTLADARRLIEKGQCNHFNLKISKHGGLFATLRILELARRHGIPCQLGAHYGETSLLTAAGMVVAALAPELTACEGALGTHLLVEDIVRKPLQVDEHGLIREPDLSFSGWPRAVDELRLNRYAQRT